MKQKLAPTQQWHHVHSLKVGRHPSSTLHWHPAMAPPPPPTTAHYNGTLQWHPAMAPRPLPQSWSSPPPTIAHYNGSLAPSNTSAPPNLVVTLPLNHSTPQWHPTMAPSNGTTSTAPCNGTLVPRPIRQSGSSPPPIGSKNPYSYRSLGKKNPASEVPLLWQR